MPMALLPRVTRRLTIPLAALVAFAPLASAPAVMAAEGSWRIVGGGLQDTRYSVVVYDMATDGSGALYVAGQFDRAGGVAVGNIAKWDGTTWSALGTGTNATIRSIAVTPGGTLYAAGMFSTAGGSAANGFAVWNGTSWNAVSGFTGSAERLALAADGTLYAAGNGRVFRSGGGSTWTQLGGAFNGSFGDLLVDGTAVYASGAWTRVTPSSGPDVEVNRIAKWDGTAWVPLAGGADQSVDALLMDGGTLIAGGEFTTIGGVSASRIARWNGTTWSPLGSGADQGVYGLSKIGGTIYATGNFTTIGGISANRVASWDGSAWDNMGNGTTGGFGSNNSLIVGPGGLLYVGGMFTSPVVGIATWSPGSEPPSGTSSEQVPVAPPQAFAVPSGTTATQCGELAPAAVDWQALQGMRTRGWSVSYASWPNGGAGGFVCERQPSWNGSGWDFR